MAAVTLTIDTTMHKASMAQRTAIQVAKMDEKLAGQVKHSIFYNPRVSVSVGLYQSQEEHPVTTKAIYTYLAS